MLGLIGQQKKFSPKQLSGLQLWLDASQLALADNAQVASWTDLSGNGYNATQATEAKRPTFKTGIQNGLPIIRFDGLDDFLQTAAFLAALSQPNTIFIVFISNRTGDPGEVICDGIVGTSRHMFGSSSLAAGKQWSTFAGIQLWAASVYDNAPHVASLFFNTTAALARLDGTQIISGDNGTQTLTGVTLGCAATEVAYGATDIAEYILYDRLITTGERDRVETYLSRKWGVALV